MAVLSKEDFAFWEKNGYVVIPNAVPQENLDAMVDVIWEFLDMDRNNPEDWYKYSPYTRDNKRSMISAAGMVEIYQHQALWNNRQYPKIHQAFADIWGREDLWVSLDRANMKPPAREDKPEWNNKGMIHWDVDTSQDPIPFGVQGVLYLTDTAEDQGGFQCVPGFHNLFPEWVKTQPADRNPRHPDLAGLEVKSIPGKAGDLLIWHRLLAHGNGHNRSDKPRLAQYITMSPANFSNEEARMDRVSSWQECRPMPRWPGDPREWEKKTQKPAVLTDLGKKLLGVEPWN
jgi:ectoine hydroxylase-related dioxygenase (phytanoyl-CoA dioxygenase family)